jgi:hypothetical protein
VHKKCQKLSLRNWLNSNIKKLKKRKRKLVEQKKQKLRLMNKRKMINQRNKSSNNNRRHNQLRKWKKLLMKICTPLANSTLELDKSSMLGLIQIQRSFITRKLILEMERLEKLLVDFKSIFLSTK